MSVMDSIEEKYQEEIATLKAERDLLKKHQAICECGGLSIDHNLSDNHQVSDMISPCPFSEQIAALKDENTALTVALTEQRKRMGTEYDDLDEKLKNVQSIAVGEIQDYAKTVERLNKLTATLKAEFDTEKAMYKSMCEHHEAQTEDYDELKKQLEVRMETVLFSNRENKRLIAERDGYREQIAAHEEYEALLIEEINAFAGLAYVHGFQSENAERGKACRAKIAALKATKDES